MSEVVGEAWGKEVLETIQRALAKLRLANVPGPYSTALSSREVDALKEHLSRGVVGAACDQAPHADPASPPQWLLQIAPRAKWCLRLFISDVEIDVFVA